MSKSIMISCPKCNNSFPIEDALEKEMKEKLEKEHSVKVEEEKAEIQRQKKVLEAEKEKVDEKVNEKIKAEKEKIKAEARKSTQEEFEEKMKALEEENKERKTENLNYKKKEVALMKKERELEEQKEQVGLEAERKLLEGQKEIEIKAREKEQKKSELVIKELQKKLEDQVSLTKEMQRKAEQGSEQGQGEIQELALEEMLKDAFPFDRISDVPKGVAGADIIQTVVNNAQQDCGTIIYESKRTKSFSDGWIEKLKKDQRTACADMAVIVTETMPKDMQNFGQKNGVWICNYADARSVAFVLRETMIKIAAVNTAQTNRGEKKEAIYNYVTGTEFKQQIEAIVEGFSTMTEDLGKEKTAIQKLWKTREKQIEQVIQNTVGMHGAIKGIAGNAIKTVPSLELGSGEEQA